MTDKELRKLKRADLLEILFYLRKELDELRGENESLKAKLEEKVSADARIKAGLSDEAMQAIAETVKRTVESTLLERPPNNADDSLCKSGQYSDSSEKGKKDHDGTEL